MEARDFAINAQVRQVLRRHWVCAEAIDIGTTCGVVLLRGQLALEPGGGLDLDEEAARVRFLGQLRGEVRAIPGVVDVVMEFHRHRGVADGRTGTDR